jgi:DnaJ-class molecular chaperone
MEWPQWILDEEPDSDYVAYPRRRDLYEALRDEAYQDEAHGRVILPEVRDALARYEKEVGPSAQCPACGGTGKQPGEPQPDEFGNYTPCDGCEGAQAIAKTLDQ